MAAKSTGARCLRRASHAEMCDDDLLRDRYLKGDEASRPRRRPMRVAIADRAARLCSPSTESLPHVSMPRVKTRPWPFGG